MNLYQSFCSKLNDVEVFYANRNDNDFYKTLGEMDQQLDLFRELLESVEGVIE